MEGGPGRHAHPLGCHPSSNEQQPLKNGEMVGGAQQSNMVLHSLFSLPQVVTEVGVAREGAGEEGVGGYKEVSRNVKSSMLVLSRKLFNSNRMVRRAGWRQGRRWVAAGWSPW